MSVPFERAGDERFADLPDFPWPARHLEWEGLRLARVDEAPAEERGGPVIFCHGEPTWSFLWRHVIPPVLEAGHRCIAPDMPGFGRSDKPVDLGWYSYDRHAAAMGHVLEALDLRDATMVVHDWGGPVGLRAAVAAPERIARLVILDTGLFTGEQRMTDAWKVFREFVERTEDLPISMLVNGGTARELTEAEMAAYDAPFPSPAAKAGTRAFPLMMPRSPEDPGAAAGREVVEALARDERPALVLWATEDPIIPLATGRRFAERLGLPEPEPVEGAGHFLQEDAGARIGARIAAWLGEQRA